MTMPSEREMYNIKTVGVRLTKGKQTFRIVYRIIVNSCSKTDGQGKEGQHCIKRIKNNTDSYKTKSGISNTVKGTRK